MGRWVRVLLFLGLAVASWWSYSHRAAPAPPVVMAPTPGSSESRATTAPAGERAASERPVANRRAGFRTAALLEQHFEKHGREFGSIDRDEYLRLAVDLRDRPAGGDVLEIVRSDGVITRFDRASGAFLAFQRDGTIRTLFRPRQGETYFRRQAQRPAGNRSEPRSG